MEKPRQDPDRLLHAIRRDERPESRGRLKIFFGYAAGVGKTYAMLQAAHAALARGVDVVAGYVEPHARPQTAALLEGLPCLPLREIPHGGVTLREFDLDAALARKPQLILVDELAHTNGDGCRHAKRYQDVEELLQAGVSVYTTVNVQHIESLNDTVAAITGVLVRERIPDEVFDRADQVELVDLEPQELLDRLQSGDVYRKAQAERAMENFFTSDHLTALREIALRRCADRVNLLTDTARIRGGGDYHTEEHVLVCLSSAPSNGKIIRTAARMAQAFRSEFTALFVETPDFPAMEEADRQRLRSNIRLAQQLGAKIETVYGEDVPLQIAAFARVSGVSKIVIGRSAVTRGPFRKPSLTDRLIANAPNLDIHIIPDKTASAPYRAKTVKRPGAAAESLRDLGKTTAIFILATLLGLLFFQLGFTEANIITVYILGVLLISVVTTNRAYSLASSLVSVLAFNFLFTAPRFSFHAYDKGYPVTFLVMFIAAFLTGSLAAKLKTHAQLSAQAAYRTKVLFDTNQLLQQAVDRDAIWSAAANQLLKLLEKDIVVYPAEEGELAAPCLFTVGETASDPRCLSENERAVAAWALKNNKHAGATTDTLSSAKCLYLAVRVKQNVYGVVGIVMGAQPLDALSNSVLLSILGECALALENEKNAREKEEAAVQMKNEQLRTNLLRAISHDLRTPLTSISGNASNLLSSEESFDRETKTRIYTDIYDDAMWLINLVENLLSVTRIEEGRISLNLSTELMEEVVCEALRHVDRRSAEHAITVKSPEEFLLVKMDVKLMVQVIINLVDNAVKYTPKGSQITISTGKKGDKVILKVADTGPGIPNQEKARVFDMFYSGANPVADSRRSLGLGLSLCKSIVTAHGGEITVSDNPPHGSVFTITLPAEEVRLHE